MAKLLIVTGPHGLRIILSYKSIAPDTDNYAVEYKDVSVEKIIQPNGKKILIGLDKSDCLVISLTCNKYDTYITKRINKNIIDKKIILNSVRVSSVIWLSEFLEFENYSDLKLYVEVVL